MNAGMRSDNLYVVANLLVLHLYWLFYYCGSHVEILADINIQHLHVMC